MAIANEAEVATVYSIPRRAVIFDNRNNRTTTTEAALIAAEGEHAKHCQPAKPCRPGLILSVWEPQEVSSLTRMFRALVYLLAMAYLFFGVSIISDRFMAAIEVITSQEREVELTKVTGERVKVLVRVWNETVSNLTLMALGVGSPRGDRGGGDSKQLICLCFKVWEAVLTLTFFPLTVASAFVANKHAKSFGQRLLTNKAITSFRHTPRLGKQKRRDSAKGMANGASNDVEVALLDQLKSDSTSNSLVQQKRYLDIIKRLRNENPNLSVAELERLASSWIFTEVPKTRAFYRIQAIRRMTGHGDITRTSRSRFDPVEYCVLENAGTVELRVTVDRGSLVVPTEVSVNYATVPDSALEHEDFVPTQGVLTFGPNETTKFVEIGIVDNDEYEDDEQFFVKLTNLGAFCANNPSQKMPAHFAEEADCATVMIIDDDHGGAFSFTSEVFRVPETQGLFVLEVRRHRGARGTVYIPFTVINGTAKAGKDFMVYGKDLLFLNEQTKAEIHIEIVNDDEYEKSEEFFVELGTPEWRVGKGQVEVKEGSPDGRPILGEHLRCKVVITEDKEFKNFIDKMVTNANVGFLVGTHSWRQQFAEALTVEDIDGDGSLSLKEKALHYVSLFWKLLFALIPPTDYLNGWVTFSVAIFAIGVLTAIIGDVASMFGCTIGLKDSVTAITLVAMGTSLPDTFASKTAAINDKTADSSIGNVTGSNAVNVFLGIGLAWAIAAVYHWTRGTPFLVEAGSLASSVTMFLIGSVVCFGLLQWRRYHPNIAGELGGPSRAKMFSFVVFLTLWLIYIVYSSLVAYCMMPGF
uniref:Sodium/calcium exchanger 3 n=1 Tax=Globodera pallida TaxID=36090 RepID=A0A183BVT1_GLOPA